jgi:uncharacterized protein YcfJ
MLQCCHLDPDQRPQALLGEALEKTVMTPIRTTLASLLVLPTLALAQQYQGPEPAGSTESVRYGYAQVLRADPVYERVVFNETREDCEGDAVYQRVGPRQASTGSVGGTVIGAVVGGVLGNQVGKGDGRTAATVGGAVIGGAIGNRAGSGGGTGYGYGGQEVRPGCRVVEVQREEDQLIGYDVEYRYKGDVYMSRLDNDPGTQLQVRVAVSPIDEGR